MKFNQLFLLKVVYIISISFVTLSCSSINHVKNSHKQNIDSNYCESTNTINDQKKLSYKMQLDLQNLQTRNLVYFPLNKYYILPDFFSILDMHANFLRNNPSYQIKIEGHADERGTPEYNIALGERRAFSVKIYLQSKGVLSDQMQTISYGKEKPIAFGHTEESYSKNRRAVLLY